MSVPVNPIHNVIIIGSGPAGHTAAIYAARANLKPLMFEGFMAGGVAAGGQLTMTTVVENFPGFPDGVDGQKLMENMRQQSLNCGTTILSETVTDVDLKHRPFKVVTEDGTVSYARSLILATGATAKRLGCEGEAKYWNFGISACAVCDGALPMFRNQPIAVIGGGDTAAEEALHMTHYGSHVYMLVRGAKLRASAAMVSKLTNNSKISILYNTSVERIEGNGRVVTNIVTLTTENNVTSSRKLNVAGVFYAIGHVPNTEFLNKQVMLHDNGYVKTTDSVYTSVPGVFACGDMQDFVYRQAITAAGTGCMAALACTKWLSE